MEEINSNICSGFEDFEVVTTDGIKRAAEVEWSKHPVFAGVEIKKLVEVDQCNNVFSSLLVRVKPGCELSDHVHDSQWEMHEVVAGYGKSTLGGSRGNYKVGTIVVIPKNIKHSVKAGDDGIVLLAKFF